MLLAVAALPSSAHAAAQAQQSQDDTPGYTAYGQAWLGAVDTGESWTLDSDAAGESLLGDVGTLPYLGGAGSRLWGDRLRYGFEGGGLVSWKNDSVRFFGSNNAVTVQIENELLSFEVFMGALLALEPIRGFRLYVAAGPALAWARVNNDDARAEVLPTPLNGSSIYIDLSASEQDLSAVLYGRAGMELEFPGGITAGISARYADHEFDFGSAGRLELDEVQWFLTLGSRF